MISYGHFVVASPLKPPSQECQWGALLTYNIKCENNGCQNLCVSVSAPGCQHAWINSQHYSKPVTWTCIFPQHIESAFGNYLLIVRLNRRNGYRKQNHCQCWYRHFIKTTVLRDMLTRCRRCLANTSATTVSCVSLSEISVYLIFRLWAAYKT